MAYADALERRAREAALENKRNHGEALTAQLQAKKEEVEQLEKVRRASSSFNALRQVLCSRCPKELGGMPRDPI